MIQTGTGNLDFANALLHGRRGHLHEGLRLDETCRLRTITELAYKLASVRGTISFSRLQRLILEQSIAELNSLRCHLSGESLLLYEWFLARFQLEQLKVIIRGFISRTQAKEIQENLIDLPEELALDTDKLPVTESLAQCAALLPYNGLRDMARKILSAEQDQLFLLEAGLDHEYFREMLARAGRIPSADLSGFHSLILQEIDIFHLLLVVRGKFINGFNTEQLLALHLSGTNISLALYKEMLSEPKPVAVAKLITGRAIDSFPQNQTSTPSILEVLGWNRYYRFSCRAFRASILGPGIIFSYAGIRRIEVANLTTIIEGVRLGMPADKIRARLLPRTTWEEIHV